MPVLAPGRPGGGGWTPFQFGPRRDWEYLLGPPTGGYDRPLPFPAGMSLTWRLTDYHEAEFTIDAMAGYDQGITELATDLHVLYAGVPLIRARVGKSHDGITAAGHAVTFGARSYRGLLERRVLWPDSQLSWPADTTVAALVWGLAEQTQAREGGDLGITQGTGFAGSGPLSEPIAAARAYSAGDVISEQIDVLAGTDNGFEWDVTVRDAAGQTMDLWPAAYGTARGVVLQHGDRLTGEAWSRDLDPEGYANAALATGQAPESDTGTTVAPPPEMIEVSDLAGRPEGRWDAVYATDETDGAWLRARGVVLLDAAQQRVPSWTVPLRPGAWDGPDHIWIGDQVQLVCGTGRHAYQVEELRVLELAAHLSPAGPQITLTLGQPRFDLPRALKRLLRQLRSSRRAVVTGMNPRPSYVVTAAQAPAEK